MTNFLWGTLPDKSRQIDIESLMQLAQSCQYLGLTVGCLGPDQPSADGKEAPKWTYRPQVNVLLAESSDYLMRAGRLLEQVRDLIHNVELETSFPALAQVEPPAAPALSLASAAPTMPVSADSRLDDCRAVFTALGVTQLPSGALRQALRGMFTERWHSMSKTAIVRTLSDVGIRPVAYANNKNRYLREQFFGDDVETSDLPTASFLPCIAGVFAGRTEEALPLDWVHDHWIQQCADARHGHHHGVRRAPPYP
ncbi:hypothetical protein [Amycolatopsis sp. H20-H5]|uniref:hypothetical protein n=1 Tax=Amycolatopsis sp. H20-H5 TaxID=3046309 RepID=UPI002DBE9C59|nr:hypothetical protein [Amycolatopsis sp. H20-H5]MEC3978180.1 hypothetical protein [Amycolatopsis sp. H20-H5]